MCLSFLGKSRVQIGLACFVLLSVVAPAWRAACASPVLGWMLQNNPGLHPNFLKMDPPDRTVLLPNGQTVPIYKLDQFLDVNFRLNWKSRKMEGVKLVQTQEWKLRKLMALPEFYHWIKKHRSTYRIAGKGKVSSGGAYNYLRNIKRNIWVTTSKRIKAPVGGGNGINAPSWAVWKQMNLFWHESCHVIGIHHNSGGLSGPLAGKLRNWDRQKRWNYSTIDLNSLQVDWPTDDDPEEIPGDVGDYFLGGGVLEIDIRNPGLIPGVDYDQLSVSGDATLDGELLVHLLDGFVPNRGDYFDIVHATGTITEDLMIAGDRPGDHLWSILIVSDDAGDQFLRLTAVPEPSSLLLAAVGLAALVAGGRWRRRRGVSAL